ncbi:MAG: hypothetical protein ACSLFM_11285 [Tepidiformaceae bacterium]
MSPEEHSDLDDYHDDETICFFYQAGRTFVEVDIYGQHFVSPVGHVAFQRRPTGWYFWPDDQLPHFLWCDDSLENVALIVTHVLDALELPHRPLRVVPERVWWRRLVDRPRLSSAAVVSAVAAAPMEGGEVTFKDSVDCSFGFVQPADDPYAHALAEYKGRGHWSVRIGSPGGSLELNASLDERTGRVWGGPVPFYVGHRHRTRVSPSA